MIAARSERLSRVFRSIAAALAVVAAVALLWRPSLDAELPDEAAGALAGDSALTFPRLPEARAGDAQRIVASNLFTTSRRAPARRYSPSDVPSTGTAGGEAGAMFDPSYVSETPSLLGTVLDALGDRALLLAPAVDSTARFYRVGERVGAYRVRRIEAGRVVLDGPGGRVVLELLKPNEARP